MNTSNNIDALFLEARGSEPELCDENFTKVVVNRLPARPERMVQRAWVPDMVGIVVAIVAIFFLIEPAQLIENLQAQIPQSIVISLSNVLMVSGILVLAAMSAWWIVEREA